MSQFSSKETYPNYRWEQKLSLCITHALSHGLFTLEREREREASLFILQWRECFDALRAKSSPLHTILRARARRRFQFGQRALCINHAAPILPMAAEYKRTHAKRRERKLPRGAFVPRKKCRNDTPSRKSSTFSKKKWERKGKSIFPINRLTRAADAFPAVRLFQRQTKDFLVFGPRRFLDTFQSQPASIHTHRNIFMQMPTRKRLFYTPLIFSPFDARRNFRRKSRRTCGRNVNLHGSVCAFIWALFLNHRERKRNACSW